MSTLLAERIDELRRDREHGASWMARRAVEALVEVAAEPVETPEDLMDKLVQAARRLAASRPGVGAVAGAVGRLLAAASHGTHLGVDELRRIVREEGQALVDSRRRAAASIAIQLRERLEGAVVLTHSASATVREALVHCSPARVACTVSYPVEEGRAFAEDLRGEGLEVELVEDESAREDLAGATIFLIGADTVFRDGTVCNKIGTRALAHAAEGRGIPTVVACEIIKLAPIDDSEAPELDAIERTLFDMTPPELIDEIVTEEGAHSSEDIRSLVDRTPFLRDGYGLLRPLGVGS